MYYVLCIIGDVLHWKGLQDRKTARLQDRKTARLQDLSLPLSKKTTPNYGGFSGGFQKLFRRG